MFEEVDNKENIGMSFEPKKLNLNQNSAFSDECEEFQQYLSQIDYVD